MKRIFVILLCIFGAIAKDDTSDENPLVNAPIGKIRGSIINSRQGRRINSFRGVRYGESPTGHQRFQPPIPAADWQNVFDASEEGPSCPHPGGKLMSEDCLRLNVYTTKLPCESENVSRPVMVFFHPGGFYGFSAQSFSFGPQYLLDRDIVLVTVNYRLGALGFLNTGDNLAPGNNGLKDQVVALKWIQRNIAAFGGNPNSVTLFGYSAGSFSILLHMVSPMSKNLFHKAIAMSASPMPPDVFSGISVNGQKQLAKKQAELLDCPTDTTGSMLLCLYTKPAENFTNTLDSLFDWRGNPILLWKPAVEPEVRGSERFLTDHPYNLFKQGNFYQVPLILGVAKDEFGGVAVAYEKDGKKNNDSLYRELDDNWNTLAPIIFYYERDTPKSNYISRELKKFYFKGQPINSATNKELSEVYADGIIIFSMYRTAKIIAECSKKPVYFYKFTFQGRYSFAMWNDTTPFGVAHHDDLQYLFFMKQFFPNQPDASENAMIDVSTAMWANFAENGVPIPRDNDKLKGVTWNTFVPSRGNFLDINLHPTMKTDFFPERMRLWDRLFPLPSGSGPVKH